MEIEKYPFMIDAEILPETIPLIEKQTQYISELDLQIVLVSPQRRTIQTAVHLLKGHPQFSTLGFVLKLCPQAKEITQVMPQFGVCREQLNQLMESFTDEFPQLTFDTTLLDQLSELWWLDVLSNEKSKDKMISKTANGDVKNAYRVMLEEYANDCYGKESCIESARDCFNRTQLLKNYLR